MAETLFPVFDVPTIVRNVERENQEYRPSVFFDFDVGDFRRDNAGKLLTAIGREAYMQWCRKAVVTERLSALAYSHNYGTELEDALRQTGPEAVKSALERAITEALMVNPKTEYVREFSFTYDGAGGIHCAFTVKGIDMEEQQIDVTIQ